MILDCGTVFLWEWINVAIWIRKAQCLFWTSIAIRMAEQSSFWMDNPSHLESWIPSDTIGRLNIWLVFCEWIAAAIQTVEYFSRMDNISCAKGHRIFFKLVMSAVWTDEYFFWMDNISRSKSCIFFSNRYPQPFEQMNAFSKWITSALLMPEFFLNRYPQPLQRVNIFFELITSAIQTAAYFSEWITPAVRTVSY